VLRQKFRLYPSETAERMLGEQLELCRWLYNRLLEELNRVRAEGRRITQNDTQTLILKLKEERPELTNVYSKVLQMVNYQLWSNVRALAGLKRNGHKVGKLRFKGTGWFKTLNYNQSGFAVEGKRLLLSKVGSIPIKMHRRMKGEVKGVIIKRQTSGRWFAIFQCDAPTKRLPSTGRSVGIDVGIKFFLSDSDGRHIENPRWYRRTAMRLGMVQQALSRKRKGSSNRSRQRVRLARLHERLVDQRNDFLHKLSRYYVNNYDMIVVEDLRIRNMVKNNNLAKSILDASWGKFRQMLSCKAENAGRRVVAVNPRGTSQECKYGKIDRDYNASLNILERGLQSVSGSGRPFEPVEIEPLLVETVVIPASEIVEAGSPRPLGEGSSPLPFTMCAIMERCRQ